MSLRRDAQLWHFARDDAGFPQVEDARSVRRVKFIDVIDPVAEGNVGCDNGKQA